MTAEECLLCSPFAMVSSDCHVRNAQARTTGLGMLPSETSLADEIWNLHLSTAPLVHLYILFPVYLNPCGLCLGEPICLSQLHQKNGNLILKLQKAILILHSGMYQKMKTPQIIIG